jgi:hypothetical protein
LPPAPAPAVSIGWSGGLAAGFCSNGIYFSFSLIREQLIAVNKPIKIHGNAAPKKSLTILHSSFKIPSCCYFIIHLFFQK